MGERTSWYRGPVGTEHQSNNENKRASGYREPEEQWSQRTGGTMGPEDQRTRGTVDPEDQRKNGNIAPEDQWVQRTRGTVGKEDQRNSGNRGPEEKWA